ncbi:hypothetical protein CR513_17187, partial [Mucuna pruriens]
MLVNSMKAYGETLLNKQIVGKILRTLRPQFDHIVVANEESKDLQRMRYRHKPFGGMIVGAARTRRENGRTNCKILVKAQKSQIKILEVTTTRRMEVMENSERREVIKIEEGRRNLIKGIYGAMHVKNGVTLQMSATVIKESKRRMKLKWYKIMFFSYNIIFAKSNFWYLDTGCSNHMTGNKRWFVNLDEKVKRMVMFVDNSTDTTEGMDKVLIHRRDGQ